MLSLGASVHCIRPVPFGRDDTGPAPRRVHVDQDEIMTN